jgi:hypothetical protein
MRRKGNVVTQAPQDPNDSHDEGQAAATGGPLGPDSPIADRQGERSPAWAALDKLREAAAAHDADTGAYEVPKALRD